MCNGAERIMSFGAVLEVFVLQMPTLPVSGPALHVLPCRGLHLHSSVGREDQGLAAITAWPQRGGAPWS